MGSIRNIYYGSDQVERSYIYDTELDSIYQGDIMIYGGSDEPSYDETKIAVIKLGDNDVPTENVMYYDDTEEIYDALYGSGNDRYMVRCGSEVPTTNLDRRLVNITKLRIIEVLTPITAFSNSYYFSGCTNLKSVTLPSSIESIGNNVFALCGSLETITINKPENSISGAPWGATNATIVWTG